MRWWWPSLLVLVLGGFDVAPAHALNPLDDDAGSGRDAGDTHDEALLVTPGTITGRLTDGIDTADWYAVELQQGDVVHLALAGNRGMVLSLQGSSAGSELATHQPLLTYTTARTYHSSPFVVPTTGTWYLAVTTDLLQDAVSADYEITLLHTTHAWSASFIIHAPAARIELSWDRPVEIVASRMSDVLYEPWGTGGSLLMQEVDRANKDGSYNRTLHLSYGTRVSSTGAVEVLGHRPADAFLTPVSTGYALTLSNAMRDILRHDQVLLSTDDGARQTFAVAADHAPSHLRVVQSETWFSLEADEEHSEHAVATPVARATRNTTVPFEVTGRLTGLLEMFSDDGRGNTTLVAPSGATVEPPLVDREEPGTWTLYVDETFHSAHRTAYPYFFGADLPI